MSSAEQAEEVILKLNRMLRQYDKLKAEARATIEENKTLKNQMSSQTGSVNGTIASKLRTEIEGCVSEIDLLISRLKN